MSNARNNDVNVIKMRVEARDVPLSQSRNVNRYVRAVFMARALLKAHQEMRAEAALAYGRLKGAQVTEAIRLAGPSGGGNGGA